MELWQNCCWYIQRFSLSCGHRCGYC